MASPWYFLSNLMLVIASITGRGRHSGQPRGSVCDARQAEPFPQGSDGHGKADEGARNVSVLTTTHCRLRLAHRKAVV